MKKIILLITSVIISTTCSYARVPIDQCFDLYQNTKEEYKHISPAWAEIALESNLIRNIRLFGHFNSTESTSYNAHPAFNVRQDTLKLNAPQDAISALFQYLFTTIDGQILTANQRDNDPIGYIGRAKRIDLINEILCASLSFKSYTTQEADFKKSIAISLDKIRPKNDKKGSRKKKFNAIRDQFIHILTNAIIEDRDNLHQSKYPEHAVSLSLFSFALTIADNVNQIYENFPSFFKKIILQTPFKEKDYTILKNEIIQDPKFKNDVNTEKLIHVLLGYSFFEKKLPNPLAYVTTSYTHNNEEISYPNCGETSLLNFFYYMWGDRGIINPTYVNETEKQIKGTLNKKWYDLKEYFLKFNHISTSATREAQLKWSDLVSNLNTPDTDPSLRIIYRKEVCNVQGVGVINMLNVLEKLIPDQLLTQIFPKDEDALLSLVAEKMNVLCALFSRQNMTFDWTIDKKKKINDLFKTFDFTLNNESFFEWKFPSGHFVINPAKDNQNDWRKNISWHKGPYLLKGWMHNETNKLDAINQPAELYYIDLLQSENAGKAIDLILGNRWQNLYPHIPQLIGRSLPVEDRFAQHIIYTLLRFYENGIDGIDYSELNWKTYIPNFKTINTKDILTFAAQLKYWNVLKNYALDDNIDAKTYGYAIEAGHLPTIQWICKQDPNLVYKAFKNHEDLIQAAYHHQNKDIIDYFNPKTDYTSPKGKNLLHIAANTEYDNTFDLQNLLAQHIKVDATDDHLNTPLHTALSNKHANPNNIKLLIDDMIKKDISLNMQNKYNETPLHLSINNNIDTLFYYLIENGAKIHALDVDAHKNNLLHLAARQGKLNIVKFLIETKNFDPNQKNDDEENALFIAINGEKFDVIHYLIKKNTNINVLNNNKENTLHIILRYKDFNFNDFFNIAKLLIKLGENLNLKDKYGLTPMHYVLSNHSVTINILDTLIKEGGIIPNLYISDDLSLDTTIPSPRHYKLLLSRNHDRLKSEKIYNFLILENLLNIHDKDEEGNTDLHKHIKHANLKLLQQYLEYGIDPNIQNNKGETAILKKFLSPFYFEINAETEHLLLLLEHEANLHLEDHLGNNLFTAFLSKTCFFDENDKKFILFLLDHGFSVNKKDTNGTTLLHKLCENPHENFEFIRKIVEDYEADINALDNMQQTPLHDCYDTEITNYLINKGARKYEPEINESH